jgi:hypothetical protein
LNVSYQIFIAVQSIAAHIIGDILNTFYALYSFSVSCMGFETVEQMGESTSQFLPFAYITF